MKLRFRIFLIIAVALIATAPSVAKKNGKASAKFSEQTYDFGIVKEKGGAVSHDFIFENSGDGNLVIIDATAECGCTKPEYPDNPVAPGKKDKIKVTYNPIGRPGAFEKVVTVKTNGTPKKVRLKIKGTVTPGK